MTDIPRVNGPCDHYRCDGGPCKQYAPEAFEETDEIRLKVSNLIASGWKSTSTKYRSLARINPVFRLAFEIALRRFLEDIRQIDTRTHEYPQYSLERHLADAARSELRSTLRTNHNTFVEKMELSPAEFRCFKKMGGECA